MLVTLSVIHVEYHILAAFADCHFAECRCAGCRGTLKYAVIMMSVFMLSDEALGITSLSLQVKY